MLAQQVRCQAAGQLVEPLAPLSLRRSGGWKTEVVSVGQLNWAPGMKAFVGMRPKWTAVASSAYNLPLDPRILHLRISFVAFPRDTTSRS